MIVLLSCSEPTAPEPDPRTVVSVSVPFRSGPTWTHLDDSTTTVTCSAQLRATATGTGHARWGDYELRLFALEDRSAPVDVFNGSNSQAALAWGLDTIAPGETLETQLELTIGVPYALDVVFRYVTVATNQVDSTKLRIRCEPIFNEAQPPAPPTVDSIRLLTVGTVQPGDTVRFVYHASAAAGLWRSTAWIASTCYRAKHVFEFGGFTRTNTVGIEVPATCPLGEDLTAGVKISDSFLREASLVTTQSLEVRDVTPPTVSAVFKGPEVSGFWWLDDPTGDYFVGDSLRMLLTATDNSQLSLVTIGGSSSASVDTVPAVGPSWTGEHMVHLGPEWIGSPDLRVRARDLAGNWGPVWSPSASGWRVHPTRAVTTRLTPLTSPVLPPVADLLVSEALDLAVTNLFDIKILSISTGAVLRTVVPPATAAAIDLTLGRDTLVAFLVDRTIAVLDLTSPTSVMTRIPFALTGEDTLRLARNVRVLAGGRTLVTAGFENQDFARVFEVDLATGAHRVATEFTTAFWRIDRDATGARAVLWHYDAPCARRLDVASWTLGPEICGLPGKRQVAFDPFADRFAVGAVVVDASTGEKRSLAPVGWYDGTFQSAFDLDGLHLHAAAQTWTGHSLVRSRLSDGAIIDRVLLGGYPARLVPLADGRRFVTLLTSSDEFGFMLIQFP